MCYKKFRSLGSSELVLETREWIRSPCFFFHVSLIESNEPEDFLIGLGDFFCFFFRKKS